MPPRRLSTLLALAVVAAATLVSCGGSDESGSTASTASNAGTAGLAKSVTEPAPTTTTLVGARPSVGCSATPDGAAGADGASSGEQKVTIDGVERTYVVSADGVKPDRPAPLVLLLHGMGMDASFINGESGLAKRGPEAGVVVVTPQALGQPTMWQPAAQGPDAKFIDRMVDDVAKGRCIDEARIHVVGFSVGAVLAAGYSCARQDRIASIVTVTVEGPAGCTRPMPILSFHGTADPVIAYGNDDPSKGEVTGTLSNMQSWAETAGCEGVPDASDESDTVTKMQWPACQDDAEVVLYRIRDGGHAWPTGLDATGEILAFVDRHHI